MPNETMWFLDSHITVQLAHADSADGLSVLLLTMARDDAPPLHMHRAEDEVFHILDGIVRFQVGGAGRTATAGETVLGPRGIPHAFRVVSDTARMLIITRGGFEGLVRAMARPALTDGPPPPSPPTPEMQAQLAAICAAHQIDILGPPIG